MKITKELLQQHNACEAQVVIFEQLYPDGIVLTGDILRASRAGGLLIMWLTRLLPLEGSNSQRAFALWCANQAVHLNNESCIQECIDKVQEYVNNPSQFNYNNMCTAKLAVGAYIDAEDYDSTSPVAKIAKAIASADLTSTKAGVYALQSIKHAEGQPASDTAEDNQIDQLATMISAI